MRLLSIPIRIAMNVRDRFRLLFKAASTLVVKTNVRRWREVARNPRPNWDGRNEIIAKLIPAGSSVIDLGCGSQTLRRHLDPSCKYQPCDVIQSTPDVIYCDFNSGIYPNVNVSYDYVICSGVFEYIRNPEEFLKKNSLLGKVMILSYNPLYHVPEDSKIRRLNLDWINHFTKPEVEALFDKVGLVWKIQNAAANIGEDIYLLRIRDKKGSDNE